MYELRRELVFDFEFTQDIDEKGERAAPLCAVYKEIKSGKYYRCMGDDLKKSHLSCSASFV